MENKRKRITMQDVAEALDISKNAVSIALSNREGVSDELRAKILETATSLGYDFSKKRRENDGDIAILIPAYIETDRYFYYEIFWEIENEAARKNKKIVRNIINCNAPIDTAFFTQLNSQYQGVIAIGVFPQAFVVELVRLVKRVVFVDNYYPKIKADYILTANQEATAELVDYLISMGHTDIAFVGSKDLTSSLHDRWIGFINGMKSNKLHVDYTKCITPTSELVSQLSDEEEILSPLEELHYNHKMPTAWITGNDRVAYSLINLLTKMGYKVPQDVSVVGFDDMEFSAVSNPPLTTQRVPRALLAKEAISVLVKKKDSTPIKKREYFTTLVERNSVAPPRANK